ncbi:MAG: nuclear transport factor 2 family protein [Xanthomonadaceae bacterium]|nr:nuclear transport factor 2 family protein [Xanthomonadaceae bacterium]
MKHPNAKLFDKLYAAFKSGNYNTMLSHCDEKVTFQIAGQSKLAGKYDRMNFESGLGVKLKELSGGTFTTEIHDVMAGDLHAMVLMTNKVTRAGKTLEYRSVHVWRIQNGKPLAGYEYPRDMYQFDLIWS